ncbi:MAG: hypothetical protein JEZ14_08725 [Marinilabiliaceae bacterium]|nr:hypothetical protein [Marinilabiliaceae bacterium]
MRKKVPYVNLETVKDQDGNIEAFKIRTVSYLPKDSKPTGSGEGKVADKILYRPLTINYSGTSTEFYYFDVDFTVKREEVGLLERGVNVKVKSNGVTETRTEMEMSSEVLKDGDGNTGGITVEYEEDEL